MFFKRQPTPAPKTPSTSECIANLTRVVGTGSGTDSPLLQTGYHYLLALKQVGDASDPLLSPLYGEYTAALRTRMEGTNTKLPRTIKFDDFAREVLKELVIPSALSVRGKEAGFTPQEASALLTPLSALAR